MSTLAVSLPLTGVDVRDGLALTREAQEWGYEACWASEVQGPDAMTQLGALAATTEMDLGVAVVPVQTRTAVVLGMTAVSLSQLTGGRFTLGIGASSEVIVSRWAGQPFDRPLTHVRETVEALRPILRGERSTFEGDYVSVGGYRPHAPPPDPVPLFVGALNEKSLRQTGAMADGVCLNQVGPRHLPELLRHVRDGAKGAGRDIDPGGASPSDETFGVMVRVFCAVTDDVPAARELVKSTFAPYVATSVYNRFYRSLGYEDDAAAVLAASEERDREAMTAALSDRLVDDVFVLGDPDTVGERVREYAENGADIVAVQPLSLDLDSARETFRAVAERW